MSSFNNIPEDKPATYKQSWALAYKFASELEDEIGIPQKSLAKIIQGTIYYYHKERGESLTHGIVMKHLEKGEPCPDHYKSSIKLNDKSSKKSNEDKNYTSSSSNDFSISNPDTIKTEALEKNRINQFYDKTNNKMKDLHFEDLIDFLPNDHKEKLLWFWDNRKKAILWTDIQKEGMANQAKGIFKPADWNYSLSVKNTIGINYNDGDLFSARDGCWMVYYCPEDDERQGFNVYTNKSLLNNSKDLVPVGYLHQVKQKPGATYRVLGPALVRYEKSINRFHLHGFSDEGIISNYLIDKR